MFLQWQSLFTLPCFAHSHVLCIQGPHSPLIDHHVVHPATTMHIPRTRAWIKLSQSPRSGGRQDGPIVGADMPMRWLMGISGCEADVLLTLMMRGGLGGSIQHHVEGRRAFCGCPHCHNPQAWPLLIKVGSDIRMARYESTIPL